MNKNIILLGIILLFACQDRQKEDIEKKFSIVETSSKLKKLLTLPQDSVIDYYDLSDDLIMDFPDLSTYKIRSLNLSHNYIDTLIVNFLPQRLENLNLSHNYLDNFTEELVAIKELKELNLSNNYIKRYVPFFFINRLDISNNDLQYLFFNWSYMYYYGYWKKKDFRNMSYLNISNNPNLSNEVWFVPSMIDTIIHNNIANDKKLKMIDYRLKCISESDSNVIIQVNSIENE